LTESSLNNAQVAVFLEEIAVTPDNDTPDNDNTATGVELFVDEPSPN